MSEQEKDVLFDMPEQPVLPTLACIGYVSDVKEPKATKKGIYFGLPLTLTGVHGARGAGLTLYLRPEFLRPGFKAESLKSIEKEGEDRLGERLFNTFIKTISNGYLAKKASTPAKLLGLSGSAENFMTFTRLRNAAYKAIETAEGKARDFTPEEIHTLFRSFFLEENNGVVFGYELKQASMEVTSVDDESGEEKKSRERTDRYEVDTVVFHTKEQETSWDRRQKASAKGGGRTPFRVAFEFQFIGS